MSFLCCYCCYCCCCRHLLCFAVDRMSTSRPPLGCRCYATTRQLESHASWWEIVMNMVCGRRRHAFLCVPAKKTWWWVVVRNGGDGHVLGLSLRCPPATSGTYLQRWVREGANVSVAAYFSLQKGSLDVMRACSIAQSWNAISCDRVS